MVVPEPFEAAIWHCLNNYDYENAIFLSERLVAEVDNVDVIHLLATCYYRAGRICQAYHMLRAKGIHTAQARYLMARCCLTLGKLAEAENILLTPGSKGTDNVIAEFGNLACFVFQILAQIFSETERKSKSIDAYADALKLNPLLWCSFQELCDKGGKLDPRQIFQTSHLDNFDFCRNSETMGNNEVNCSYVTVNTSPASVMGAKTLLCDESPFMSTSLCSTESGITALSISNRCDNEGNGFSTSSPSFGCLNRDSACVDQGRMPMLTPGLSQSSTKDCSRIMKQNVSGGLFRDSVLKVNKPIFRQSNNKISTPSLSLQNIRRSARNFSISVKENAKFMSPRSPACKSKSRFSKLDSNGDPPVRKEHAVMVSSCSPSPSCAEITPQQAVLLQKNSTEGLMALLRQIGIAYQSLSQYDCKKAVDELSGLPPQHYNTGWVLSQIARAHFELANYQESARVFSKIREMEPYHYQTMEIYSTTLWHLRKEVELSSLAQDMVSLDRNLPETLCVTGNCFSLQREHQSAIKLFSRAIQVDPKFVYAYTLLGHEYVLMEELHKAMSCFRNAIRLNPRHYNAWYGLGSIYSKQELYMLAELHYKKALSIYPTSSLLMCHVAVMQNCMSKLDSALKLLNKAIEIDGSRNPLYKFKRASVNFSLGNYAQSLEELEQLKQIVPKESLVYYLCGKIHKKLGNPHLSLMNYSWATDLDPKGINCPVTDAAPPTQIPTGPSISHD